MGKMKKGEVRPGGGWGTRKKISNMLPLLGSEKHEGPEGPIVRQNFTGAGDLARVRGKGSSTCC